MLRQVQKDILIQTRGRGFYEFTQEVAEWVAESAISTGLITLHLEHTSASLLIQENADPDVRHDLESYFSKLVTDGDPMFVHTMEGDDDMAAHIRCALTAVQLSLPVSDGRPRLGTWQGIYLWEHRYQGHYRRIASHLVGE